ncbi:MAG: hypothetical protein IJ794_14730 [Lachnospiraceae bacterium]|nr:hypothetical protein [Lachnospiraceae bacterium]
MGYIVVDHNKFRANVNGQMVVCENLTSLNAQCIILILKQEKEPTDVGRGIMKALYFLFPQNDLIRAVCRIYNWSYHEGSVELQQNIETRAESGEKEEAENEGYEAGSEEEYEEEEEYYEVGFDMDEYEDELDDEDEYEEDYEEEEEYTIPEEEWIDQIPETTVPRLEMPTGMHVRYFVMRGDKGKEHVAPCDAGNQGYRNGQRLDVVLRTSYNEGEYIESESTDPMDFLYGDDCYEIKKGELSDWQNSYKPPRLQHLRASALCQNGIVYADSEGAHFWHIHGNIVDLVKSDRVCGILYDKVKGIIVVSVLKQLVLQRSDAERDILGGYGLGYYDIYEVQCEEKIFQEMEICIAAEDS